ncbi:major facilitator superfamily domain-containing protein [Pestalotiopsis sp. NC0098]|nr:major facilitator superfamily domain-containing protein [Pestalotiopsis sp. NC0098]
MSESTSPPAMREPGNVEANGEKSRSPEDTLTGNSSPVNGALEKPESENKALAAEEQQQPPAETPAAPPPMTYPKGLHLVGIMSSLVLTIGMMSLDTTIVATAIPKITDHFKKLDDIAWYGSAYFLTLGAFQSQWGKIYKYIPLKTAFLTSVFIFEVGSLICGVAQNSTTLIVGRAIAGFGGSGIAPGVYIISAFSAPPAKRATYTGLIGAAYGVFSVIGPLIGGALTDKATWRWCFYINLPIGGVAAAVIAFTFKTPAAHKPAAATFKDKLLHMDFPGTMLVLGASLCLVLALQYGGQAYAWNSSVVIGLFVGFALISALLVVVEIYQGELAMLTPRLMRTRIVWVSAVWGFFFAGSYFAALYYLPIYFQSIKGTSAIGSGVRNIPFIAMFSIGTFGSGRIITKTGIAAPYMPASSVIITIGSGLLYTLGTGTSTGKWVGYQLLAGFGFGIGLQIPVIMVQAYAAPADIAVVSAVIIFARSMGATFMLAAAQAGFTNQLSQRLASTAPDVDRALVLATGATDIRSVFSGADLIGIISAYEWGIKVAFAIIIASSGVSAIFSLCTKWDNINKKKEQPKDSKA